MNKLSLRVLIVDDNKDYRQLIRWALTSALEHVVIQEMTTGQELVDWLAHHRKQSTAEQMADKCLVTIILLDMHMPGLSGLDTLQSLGDMSDLPYMPVVMLTATLCDQLKHQAYNQGIHLYMVKPIEIGGFYRVVEAVKLCYRDMLRRWEQQEVPPLGSTYH
ncbi:response regulator [Larkinella insperata]|uniref:Response regulator n=1 Tax=Larkinella insperata TaxID=332158 RepID=A0ABW3Q493_9BACT|nr:response regulator [Larkinella insperata]